MRMPPAVATAVAALSLGLTLASCSEDAEPTASDAEETPSTSSTPASPSSSPTDMPSSSEPTATMSVTEEPSPTMTPDTAAVDVASRLLPAARMGKLNAEWTWRTGNDFDREPKGLVSCHRFGLDSVGAENIAVREYTSELDAGISAHHLVAGFADDVTARRAYSVLESWRDGCRARLERKSKGADGIKVTDPDPVAGAGGAATSYLLIQPSPTGSSIVEDVATARAGRVVHVAVVELEGDDYNYPRGRTPAGLAVRNAAG